MHRFFQVSGATLVLAGALIVAPSATPASLKAGSTKREPAGSAKQEPAGSTAEELIPSDGSCWQRFAPRAQNAPVGELRKEGNGYALTLGSGGKPNVYGGWRCRVEGIEGGRFYRMRVQVRPKGFAHTASLRESLGAQIRWRGDFGEAVAPTYVWELRALREPAGAYEFDRVLQAPPKTRAVELELVLQWTPTGQVEWHSASLQPSAAPPARKVRVATVWLRPRNSPSGGDSVRRFAEYIDRIAPAHRPDVIVLGEMINRVGVAGEPEVQAEPIPGPTTERMVSRRGVIVHGSRSAWSSATVPTCSTPAC